jgi:hypothetical protein
MGAVRRSRAEPDNDSDYHDRREQLQKLKEKLNHICAQRFLKNTGYHFLQALSDYLSLIRTKQLP